MKKLHIICLLSVLMIVTKGYTSNKIGISQEIYTQICGVWDTKIITNTMADVSWGKTKVSNAEIGSTIIDLGAESPFINPEWWGKYTITKVYKINNIYVIRILSNDKKEYDLKVSVIKGKIIIHQMKWFKKFKLFDSYGKEHPYYKIDGPTIKYYKSKIPNLRLRERFSLSSRVIRLLNKDDKLLILKKGKEKIVSGIKGHWVKVLTSKNEIGWCFDSYLEEF